MDGGGRRLVLNCAMRRVMILGSPGSGKSTLARQLGRALGLPVFHLDQLYHLPGWQPRPTEEFVAEVARVSALPGWIIDGNYPRVAPPRLAAADTIVYLHVSPRLAMARVLRRGLIGYGRQRRDAAQGCRERFDREFLRYVWAWPEEVEPRVRSMLYGFTGRVIEIHSRGEARALLASARRGA